MIFRNVIEASGMWVQCNMKVFQTLIYIFGKIEHFRWHSTFMERIRNASGMNPEFNSCLNKINFVFDCYILDKFRKHYRCTPDTFQIHPRYLVIPNVYLRYVLKCIPNVSWTKKIAKFKSVAKYKTLPHYINITFRMLQ